MKKKSCNWSTTYIEIIIIVMIVALGLAIVIPNIIAYRNSEESIYERYLKEWNDDVANGRYRARIDDEILVYEITRDDLAYMTESDDEFFGHDIKYKKVILLFTSTSTYAEIWIKADLIRPVHSNWGLTQDVWYLDKRITDLERGKKCFINDNPHKPKRAK